MKYTRVFLIKLVMTLGLIGIVLGLFFGVSIGDIFIIAGLLTLAAFVVDILVLPKIGNIMAAVGDLALTFLVVWILGSALFEDNINLTSAALLSSLFIAGGELYYHRYLRDHLFINVDRPNNYSYLNEHKAHRLQTEFSEEFDPDLENNIDPKNRGS